MTSKAFDNLVPVECHSRYNRLVRARRDGRWWMLKGLKPDYQNDAVMRELLRKEFNLGMLLRHQGVVGFVAMEQVLELGGTFIVQEWVEGVTLKQWLKQPHSTEEKADIMLQLADVLAYCHSMNVVHRDIKPSNIMVTPSDQVVLVDFGLAVAGNYSAFRSPAGTEHYMAPEQRQTDIVVDGRADLYAVGHIMQEMDLPRRYNKVIKKLLQPECDRRLANATELRAQIVTARQAKQRMLHWTVVAALTVAILVGAFLLGRGTLGKSLLGVGKATAPIMPDYLTADTANYWVADTAHYLTYVDTAHDVCFSYPRMPMDIPGPIDESVAVDLGLSVLWAPFNVGCDRANLAMTGGYYGYGEPTGKIQAISPMNVNKYWTALHGDYSGTAFDIARVQWGHRWRTPRKTEVDELLNCCQLTLVKPKGRPAGFLVVGPNGNRMFLPLAGFRYDNEYYEQGKMGFYWMACVTREESLDYGLALCLRPEGIQYMTTIVNNGFNVRPVLDR